MKRHGGKRTGAGRPRLKDHRVTLAVRVLPITKQRLEDSSDYHGSVGKLIDFMVANFR